MRTRFVLNTQHRQRRWRSTTMKRCLWIKLYIRDTMCPFQYRLQSNGETICWDMHRVRIWGANNYSCWSLHPQSLILCLVLGRPGLFLLGILPSPSSQCPVLSTRCGKRTFFVATSFMPRETACLGWRERNHFYWTNPIKS